MPQDPDALLQRLVDATSTELRRIRANAKVGLGMVEREPGRFEAIKTCDVCKRDFGMSVEERKFMIEAGKLISGIVFGARKLFAEKVLRSLSEGQLEAFAEGMKQRGDKWLPEP